MSRRHERTVGLLARHLDDLTRRLRPLLGPDIALTLRIDADCPDSTAVDPDELESVLVELVRCLISVLPQKAVIELRARRTHHFPHPARSLSGARDDAWLTFSVASLEAGPLDADWQAHGRHRDMARFAAKWGAALSVTTLGRHGLQLALHLPCDPAPSSVHPCREVPDGFPLPH